MILTTRRPLARNWSRHFSKWRHGLCAAFIPKSTNGASIPAKVWLSCGFFEGFDGWSIIRKWMCLLWTRLLLVEGEGCAGIRHYFFFIFECLGSRGSLGHIWTMCGIAASINPVMVVDTQTHARLLNWQPPNCDPAFGLRSHQKRIYLNLNWDLS